MEAYIVEAISRIKAYLNFHHDLLCLQGVHETRPTSDYTFLCGSESA